MQAQANNGADGGQGPAAPAGPTGARRAESAVEGLVRRDGGTVALALGGESKQAELLLHGFEFEGNPVDTSKLHFRRISPTAVEITSVAYSLGEWRFLVHDQASYFGLGEHFDTLNRAHTIVKNASQDNGGPKGSSSYKPIPFFRSTSGYGMWVDTTSDATFDMNVSTLGEIEVVAAAERLRIVLFTDASFAKMLEEFTGLTQRAVVPPPWAFAPWMGRSFLRGDAEIRATVDKARELQLPGSVVLMDEPWETSSNSYEFNPKQFADAPGDVKRVHEQAYKVVLWHTPWVNSKSDAPGDPELRGRTELHAETYDEAAAKGYFVRRPDGGPWVGRWWMGEGSLVDFTNPAAKQWWQEQLRGAIRAGADGFKDDDAEGNFQGDVRFADGSAKETMRNRYAVLYNNAVNEVLQKDLKGNGVVLARSISTGANGLGFVWAGDNESSFSRENGLPTVITAGLSAGMSGIPLWTADVGGYLRSPTAADATLLSRWTEFAALSPVMEVFSSTNALPWEWPAPAFAVYRRYAALHMSLFPYRYAAALEASKTGMPMMRALPLVFEKDARARACGDEYMFGPDLLVAPVADENTRRPVYLPQGEWVDYWTGVQVSGGKVVVVDAPMDTLPLWVRAGAVVPKIPEDVMTLVPEAESGNKAVKGLDERRVYEVFGESGEATLTDFEGREVVRSGRTLRLRGEKPAHVIVRLRYMKVRGASVGGTAVKTQQAGDASVLEFDLKGEATVSWQ